MTATAAATAYQQRPATAHDSRTISANLAYATAEMRTVVQRRRPPRTWPTHYGPVSPRCPRTAIKANDRHLQQHGSEYGRALNPRAANENTLVMRSSLGGDEDQGAGAPTVCTRPQTTCPLRARSAGQRRVFAVTPGQPDTQAQLRTGRLTRCAYRPSKLGSTPPKAAHDSHAPCLAGSFVMRMTVKVTTNLGHARTTVEGPHGL